MSSRTDPSFVQYGGMSFGGTLGAGKEPPQALVTLCEFHTTNAVRETGVPVFEIHNWKTALSETSSSFDYWKMMTRWG